MTGDIKHSTAEISRRPGSEWAAWSAPPTVVSRPRLPARAGARQKLTARIGALGAALRNLPWWTRRSRSRSFLLMIVPAVLAVAALLAI